MVKEIKQQMEEDIRQRMDIALRNLHTIIEPINYKGKIKYADKFNFIDKNGIEKMFKEIKNIVECVEWLRDFTGSIKIAKSGGKDEQ